MKRLFFIFFSMQLFATLNEPLRVEWFSNYRNDRIHWHLPEFSEIYRDVQFWENGLNFKAIHRDLTFFVRGSYGTFGKGEISNFDFSTKGWCADAVGYFGYAVNLTDGRIYKVILTPLIGYSGYFEQLKHQPIRLVWNGFFFGGSLAILPNSPLSWTLGYSYHLMHNRIHVMADGGSIRRNSHGNGGQTGWAQIDWALNLNWKIGINGLIHYFSTTSQSLKLRWTVISAGLQISRQF